MGEKNPDLRNSFDHLFENKNEEQEETLAKKFERQRNTWKEIIDELSNSMKNLDGLLSLMDRVYSERQKAVDYYHYLHSLVIKLNKTYRKEFANRYNYHTWQSQRRFPNDKTKTNQILTEIEDLFEKLELVKSHQKHMEKTIGTLDNIIFGIKSRIEIEQIKRGK